jgi:hypothetical protein
LVEHNVIAPVETADVERERFGGLDGDAGGFGEGEALSKGSKGGIGVAEAVEEDQDVGG